MNSINQSVSSLDFALALDISVPFFALRLGFEAVLVLQLLNQLGIALGVLLSGRIRIDGWGGSVLLGWAEGTISESSPLLVGDNSRSHGER